MSDNGEGELGQVQHSSFDELDADGADAPATAAPRRKKLNPLLEWVIVAVVAITSALLVRAYVVQQFAVEGESMLNTLP